MGWGLWSYIALRIMCRVKCSCSGLPDSALIGRSLGVYLRNHSNEFIDDQLYLRLKVLTAVKIFVSVSRVLSPCGLAGGY